MTGRARELPVAGGLDLQARAHGGDAHAGRADPRTALQDLRCHEAVLLEQGEGGGGGARPAAERLGRKGTVLEELEQPEGVSRHRAQTQRVATPRCQPHPSKRPRCGARGNRSGKGGAEGTEHGLGLFA